MRAKFCPNLVDSRYPPASAHFGTALLLQVTLAAVVDGKGILMCAAFTAIEVRYRSDGMSRAAVLLDKLVSRHIQNGFVVGSVSEPCPICDLFERPWRTRIAGIGASSTNWKVLPCRFFFLSELTRLEGRITAAVRDQPDVFPEGSAQIKAIRTPLHLCNDETALASHELVTDMLS